MELTRQAALGTHFEWTIPVLKIGKVIRVRPGAETIDVTFLDGGYGRAIPVLRGWASTVSGFAHLDGPSVDDSDPASPTYLPQDILGILSGIPIPISIGGSEGGVGSGTVGSGQISGSRQPPAVQIDGQTGARDIYAICMPAEGFMIGSSGLICIGFMYDSRGEMLFPADERLNDFGDFMIVRHTSDVQVTIDKFGTVGIEHPAGTRITIGDTDAIHKFDVLQPQNRNDLTGLDSNHQYRLRNNLSRQPGIILVDTVQGRLVIDGKGKVILTDLAKNVVELDANAQTITLKQENGNEEVMGTNGIIIQDKGGDKINMFNEGIEITDRTGNKIRLGSDGISILSNGVPINVDAGFANPLNLNGTPVNING